LKDLLPGYLASAENGPPNPEIRSEDKRDSNSRDFSISAIWAATSIIAVFPPPTFKEFGGAEASALKFQTLLSHDARCYFNVFTNSAIAPAWVSSSPEMLLL
jgi:hypothetical protein